MNAGITEQGRAGWVVTLCWIAVILDGFDLVVLGALIPTLTGGDAPFMTGAEATFASTIGLVGRTLGALSIGVATGSVAQTMLMAGGYGRLQTH